MLVATAIFLSPISVSEFPLCKQSLDFLPEKREVILVPELVKICTCESGLKHFDSDGNVLRGEINPLDIGICQINLKYHEAQAKKLGYDLFIEQDNIAYANWLYQQQGTTPWKWSASCWNK